MGGESLRKRVKIEDEVVRTDTVWDSGLKIIKNPKVLIPLKILLVCQKIQEKIGYKEFSILCRGAWYFEGFKVSEDYIIPEQEVTSSSVDYLEPLEQYKQRGYNVVIHSHPWGHHYGGTSFSASDEETINAHFVCSVLFNGKQFCEAVISVQVNSNMKLQIPCSIEIIYPEISVPSEELAKIREKQVTLVFPFRRDDYYH